MFEDNPYWKELFFLTVPNGENILHDAAKNENVKLQNLAVESEDPTVRELLSQTTPNGETPTHLARKQILINLLDEMAARYGKT